MKIYHSFWYNYFEKSDRLKKSIIPIEKRKYRISIINSMKETKVLEYGFEKSYFLFEKSINKLSKSGDYAEKCAIEYLIQNKILSENFATNKVITLNSIRIEADIIDYDNKIIYETKSRKTGIQAKMAIKKKWAIFEYDKHHSRYQDYTFKGIVVSNYEDGMKIKGIADFSNDQFNEKLVESKFNEHFERINYLTILKNDYEFNIIIFSLFN